MGPFEYFIEIAGFPHLRGRLTLHLLEQVYEVQVDLVFSQGSKIYRHVGVIQSPRAASSELSQGSLNLVAGRANNFQDNIDLPECFHDAVYDARSLLMRTIESGV